MTDLVSLPTKSICLSTALPAVPVPIPVTTTYDKYLSGLKDTHLSIVSDALKIISIYVRGRYD